MEISIQGETSPGHCSTSKVAESRIWRQLGCQRWNNHSILCTASKTASDSYAPNRSSLICTTSVHSWAHLAEQVEPSTMSPGLFPSFCLSWASLFLLWALLTPPAAFQAQIQLASVAGCNSWKEIFVCLGLFFPLLFPSLPRAASQWGLERVGEHICARIRGQGQPQSQSGKQQPLQLCCPPASFDVINIPLQSPRLCFNHPLPAVSIPCH